MFTGIASISMKNLSKVSPVLQDQIKGSTKEIHTAGPDPGWADSFLALDALLIQVRFQL